MGLLGKVMRKKRLTRRMPESSRKRKLGGNSRDHRPYFTYWVTFVQTVILVISLLLYGLGPIGVDLYKRSNMVSINTESINQNTSCTEETLTTTCNLIFSGASYITISGEYWLSGTS